MTTNLYDTLSQRGFVHDSTTNNAFLSTQRTIYVGFDPTSDSLHLGSLVPIMAICHALRHGHKVIVLVGGGTAMIGDPSGKSEERDLTAGNDPRSNQTPIILQLKDLVRRNIGDGQYLSLTQDNSLRFLSNFPWINKLNIFEYLRDVGKHFSVNEMIKRDSVRIRLEERNKGISYTEFSYMLLQAYDFKVLYEEYGCTLQMGGSDQWGNILSGRDLIRRSSMMRHGTPEGITFPLLTTSSGKKFGKTEEGAIWLDAKKTSPYKMYQYLLSVPDDRIQDYLGLLTFCSGQELEVGRPHPKMTRQELLAYEVVTFVHGMQAASDCRLASSVLFGELSESPNWNDVDLKRINWVLPLLVNELPIVEWTQSALDQLPPADEFLVMTKLATSKSEAKRMIASGSVFLGFRPIRDKNVRIDGSFFPWLMEHNLVSLFQFGKKNHKLVAWKGLVLD